jgi:hypothetical protein
MHLLCWTVIHPPPSLMRWLEIIDEEGRPCIFKGGERKARNSLSECMCLQLNLTQQPDLELNFNTSVTTCP